MDSLAFLSHSACIYFWGRQNSLIKFFIIEYSGEFWGIPGGLSSFMFYDSCASGCDPIFFLFLLQDCILGDYLLFKTKITCQSRESSLNCSFLLVPLIATLLTRLLINLLQLLILEIDVLWYKKKGGASRPTSLLCTN